MAKRITIILIAILLFTRIYGLEKYPVSLNWDEVSHGYNAYSILKTGQDQWSEKFPIFNFRAYGDYPTTLNMYATIPFIAILGLNEFSIRIFTALMAIFCIFSVYKLSSDFGLKNKTLLFAILVFSNTLFFTSRGVFQSTVASGIYFTGLYFFISQKKPNLGIILLVLSQFAYHNTRIVVPLLLAYLFYNSRQLFKKTNNFVLFFCILLVFTSLLNLLINKDASARNKWVSIFGVEAINTINQRRLEFGPNNTINRIINNKFTYGTEMFIKNNIMFLSPYHLFVAGTQNYQFHIPKTGLIQFISLPFFYLGLLYFLKNIRQKKSQDIIALIIIGSIPAALTQGDFPVLRLSLVLPLYFVLIAKGCEILSSKINSITPIFTIIYIFQFLIFIHNYTGYYPKNYSSAWQFGYKNMVDKIKQNYSNYDEIVITKKYGEPHEFILFYWPWDPKKFQNDTKKITDYHADWYWVDAFDKFKFVNDWEIDDYKKDTTKTTLIIKSFEVQ